MINKLLITNGIIISLLGSFFIFSDKVKSAEEISFRNGILSRTIPIKSFEELAINNKAEGTLKNLIEITNQSPEQLSDMLNKEFELPLIVTSKLMYSSIGEVFILRIGKIVHPLRTKDKKITLPAIRSAIIAGIIEGKGSLNIITFLKSYPNKKIAIDMPALFQVLEKIDSMSKLVEFFSQSPLEGIKKNKITL